MRPQLVGALLPDGGDQADVDCVVAARALDATRNSLVLAREQMDNEVPVHRLALRIVQQRGRGVPDLIAYRRVRDRLAPPVVEDSADVDDCGALHVAAGVHTGLELPVD
jgi:hypothetical protein